MLVAKNVNLVVVVIPAIVIGVSVITCGTSVVFLFVSVIATLIKSSLSSAMVSVQVSTTVSKSQVAPIRKPPSIITASSLTPLSKCLVVVIIIGLVCCEVGGKVNKYFNAVVMIIETGSPEKIKSWRVVKCTLAIRVAVIVGVSVVKIVVIPAIVIGVVKTLSGVMIVAVITEIAVVINRSCGPNCAVIIRCEYSRTIGENKSGENATADSRFCGMPKL